MSKFKKGKLNIFVENHKGERRQTLAIDRDLIVEGSDLDFTLSLPKGFFDDKPEKEKPVDLSMLVDSEIDCTFWDSKACGPDDVRVNGTLSKIEVHGYRERDRTFWRYCKPRLSPFVHACPDGFSKKPLPKGLVIKVYSRCGLKCQKEAEAFDFVHEGGESDIIAFEVVGLAEGYCWPWEVAHD